MNYKSKKDHYTNYYYSNYRYKRHYRKKKNTIEVELQDNTQQEISTTHPSSDLFDFSEHGGDVSTNLSSYTISSSKHELSEIQTDSFNYSKSSDLYPKHVEIPYLPNIYDDESSENSRNIQIPKKIFYKNLSEHILKFQQQNQDQLDKQTIIKSQLFKTISEYIKNAMYTIDVKINYYIDLYGSQATDLSLEESDVDLLVSYLSENECSEEIYDAVYLNVVKSGLFKNVQAFPKATFPIIKLEYELQNKDTIKIDMSFQNLRSIQINPNIMPTPPSIQIIQYIKQSIAYLPNLKPIILILKKVLKLYDLNNYYKGGLSSLSVVLLVLAFYKYKINKSTNKKCINEGYLGCFFIQLLKFYSKFPMDFYGIDINRNMPYYTKPKDEKLTSLVIHDPITYVNISAGTYCWEEIQSKFASISDKLLSYYKKNYNKYCNYISNYYNDVNDDYDIEYSTDIDNSYTKDEDFEINCISKYEDKDNFIDIIINDIY